MTGTRAKSKRRLRGTTTCRTWCRSYFNEYCILFRDVTKHNFGILDYMAPIPLPLLTQPMYWLRVNQLHLTQRFIWRHCYPEWWPSTDLEGDGIGTMSVLGWIRSVHWLSTYR
jgi:hypothetical protein